MRFFYFILCLNFATILFCPKERLDAEENIRQLVLAAHEREERTLNRITEVRQQIREQLQSSENHLEFDAVFSAIASKERLRQPVSEDLNAAIHAVTTLDSLQHLIQLWQKYKLHTLPLLNKDLDKETARTPVLTTGAEVWQYLPFFNIQPGNKVGELGAGSGWLSLLMSILYDSTTFYVNELGSFAVAQMQSNSSLYLTEEQLENCHFTVGSYTSTGLETNELDIIIAVDAFHHFSDKLSMLQSIKWSLAKNGRLCLVEQIRAPGTSDYFCPQALEKWELEELLQQNGFIKTKEQLLLGQATSNIYLLEYRVNPL
ncbi:MAG: methyltransferase domain-containing protein [Saprospiraceae bacterium]|nr:methyltransferase domain-containing protein [Saprospiraceae bacterium]